MHLLYNICSCLSIYIFVCWSTSNFGTDIDIIENTKGFLKNNFEMKDLWWSKCDNWDDNYENSWKNYVRLIALHWINT